MQEVVRDVPAFVRSYLASQSGQRALARGPFIKRDGKSTVQVWQNSAMAQAFKRAAA